MNNFSVGSIIAESLIQTLLAGSVASFLHAWILQHAVKWAKGARSSYWNAYRASFLTLCFFWAIGSIAMIGGIFHPGFYFCLGMLVQIFGLSFLLRPAGGDPIGVHSATVVLLIQLAIFGGLGLAIFSITLTVTL